MKSGDGAAIGVVSVVLAMAGACVLFVGAFVGESYWWLKGGLLLAAAFGFPRLIAWDSSHK